MKFPRGMTAISRLLALWIATWILRLVPDFFLYWSGYAVEAAVKLKALLFAAVIALLVTTAKSRRFRMAAIAFPASKVRSQGKTTRRHCYWRRRRTIGMGLNDPLAS